MLPFVWQCGQKFSSTYVWTRQQE